MNTTLIETKEKDSQSLDRPTLKASVNDGVATAVMVGAGESYLNAFGIFLKGTPVQIGLLSTLPPLLGAMAQAVSIWIMERFTKRRSLISLGALLHALIWIPIGLIPQLFGDGPDAVWILIGLVICYHAINGLTVPLWNSLIGDLVPPELRGKYFGYRNKMCGLYTFAALLLGGKLLDEFEVRGHSVEGFITLFAISLVSRLISAWWLSKYDDPPYSVTDKQKFSFFQFIRATPRSNFARFVFFVSSMNFAVFISGPYFSIYMLRDLQFSYLTFTVVSAAATVAQFLTMQRWGSLSDRFGNKKILNVCAIGVGLNPLLWLLSSSFWSIILIQTYSGFVWAGFNLAAANFMFDAVSPPKRARCVAYQSLVNGFFVLGGSLLGGYIATNVSSPIPFHEFFYVPESQYTFLFLVSGILRVGVAAFFLKLFKEVRAVENIKHRDLVFRITNLRPVSGATFGIVTGLVKRKEERTQLKEKPKD